MFSEDSGVNLDAVLKLPFFFIFEYYDSEAWKIKKQSKANDDQIIKNVFTHLSNIQNMLRGRR